MVEPLLHVLIPFTTLILFGISYKKSLCISLFALLPDFDVFFNVHRSITHSAVFILLICTVVFIIIHLYNINYKTNYSLKTIGLITITLLSHVVFDVFHTYTPLLYPIYNKAFWIHTELITHLDDLSYYNFVFEIKTAEASFGDIESESVGRIFTGIGLVTLAILYCGIHYRRFIK